MSSITPSSFSLTPKKRRRPIKLSLSPVKNVDESPTKKLRTLSDPSGQKPEMGELELLAREDDIDGGDLVFSDGRVSWDERAKGWKFLPNKHMDIITSYLHDHFKVWGVTANPPFLSITMQENEPIPPIQQRPFRIAGLLCQWLKSTDPIRQPLLAHRGRGDGEALILPDDIVESFETDGFPPRSSMEFIVATHFPTALAISYFLSYVVIELPPVDTPSSMKSLPRGFKKAADTGYFAIRFLWGELTQTKMKRRVTTPDPENIDGVSDDTHYLDPKEGGTFTPGMRVFKRESLAEWQEWTSGIFVTKGSVTKATVSAHGYDRELNAVNDDLSRLSLPLFQGNHKNQTQVGNIDELIIDNGSRTDIGLASIMPGIKFENTTFHDDLCIRKLIPIEECLPGDVFLVDSYITGVQKLQLVGVRYPADPRARTAQQFDVRMEVASPDTLPHPRLRYLKLGQGMYATSAKEIPTEPQIRAGVCGSALIRVETQINRKSSDVRAEGAVGGFMHLSDLRPRNDGEAELMCYADSCSALIEQGWAVY